MVHCQHVFQPLYHATFHLLPYPPFTFLDNRIGANTMPP